MAMNTQTLPQQKTDGLGRLKAFGVWLFICVIAWAPFPLGGAIEWAPALQEFLIAISFGLWILSSYGKTEDLLIELKPVAIPLSLALLVLIWAWVQTLPIVPTAWMHPLWGMTAEILGHPVRGAISLNPWRTQAELLKLLSYVMACWLAFDMARNLERAALLLKAVIVIVTVYAIYGFGLALFGIGPREIFYSLPSSHSFVTGPFVLHNSFATFCGLGTLAAMVKLVVDGSQSIVSHRGWRPLALTTVQFGFGRGAPIVLATLLCFAGVVASASRAGFAATMGGLLALALVSLSAAKHGSTKRWAWAGALICVLPLLLLVLFSGDTLSARIDQLLDPEVTDKIRLALWNSAGRMIVDSPWLGWGLGSFQDAYTLYAVMIDPHVMDKAHCDYLELAAGLGLPAALMWLGAMGWLAYVCLRGFRRRRRNRHYPLLGFAACILVSIHSAVDFSLQLPAVSVLYATILGVGIAQASSSRYIGVR
jgi:O-antigen ligase